MLSIIVTVVLFACIAFLAVELSRFVCARIAPLDGAPPSSEPPVAALVVGAAFLGALLVVRGAAVPQLAMFAIVIFALVACWASDGLRGIVPDVFTLVPLAILLAFYLAQRDWLIIASVLIPFVPFAAAAIFTKGLGMGWGDAKLVALAGAALGAPLAILAMIVACLAAVAGYRIKHIKAGPIAFAPYIAAAVGAALPLGIMR